MRVLILWSNYSGYTTACWRALRDRLGGQLKIIAFRPNQSTLTSFQPSMLDGLDVDLIDRNSNSATLLSSISREQADVIVFPGWVMPYRKLVSHSDLSKTVKVLASDNPWVGTVKQQVSTLIRRKYLRRFEAIIVPGERGYQFMRRHGASMRRVNTLMYGYDDEMFDPAGRHRVERRNQIPGRFIFVGRYIPQKGLDTLLHAYALYREQIAEEPWPLDCFGRGPLAQRIASEDGVSDQGFCDPAQLPAELARSAALILPSVYEPWGVIVVEALAAGVPVLASRACGASADVIKPFSNGLTFEPGDQEALASQLTWAHENSSELFSWAGTARASAAAYRSQNWARQWEFVLQQALCRKQTS